MGIQKEERKKKRSKQHVGIIFDAKIQACRHMNHGDYIFCPFLTTPCVETSGTHFVSRAPCRPKEAAAGVFSLLTVSFSPLKPQERLGVYDRVGGVCLVGSCVYRVCRDVSRVQRVSHAGCGVIVLWCVAWCVCVVCGRRGRARRPLRLVALGPGPSLRLHT